MNRGLRADVMRIFIENGRSDVLDNYTKLVASARDRGGIITLAEDFLFGYLSFVFIILLLGTILRRLDLVLIFYGVIFPLYYIVKAVFVWIRLRTN